jgi:hypothetical protein
MSPRFELGGRATFLAHGAGSIRINNAVLMVARRVSKGEYRQIRAE